MFSKFQLKKLHRKTYTYMEYCRLLLLHSRTAGKRINRLQHRISKSHCKMLLYSTFYSCPNSVNQTKLSDLPPKHLTIRWVAIQVKRCKSWWLGPACYSQYWEDFAGVSHLSTNRVKCWGRLTTILHVLYCRQMPVSELAKCIFKVLQNIKIVFSKSHSMLGLIK